VGKILCATRGGEGSQTLQDRAIDLARERGDELIFLFVADMSFLSQLAAPIVVDVESRLEKMGQFQLAVAQERAALRDVQAQAIVRRGRLRSELASAARELGATLIVLGRPSQHSAVFEHDTLQAFAAGLQADTGIQVRIV
jgi:nucleotide-binding universal stress UspA family protein